MADDLIRAAPEERAALERLGRQLADILNFGRRGTARRAAGSRRSRCPCRRCTRSQQIVDGLARDHAFALTTYPPELTRRHRPPICCIGHGRRWASCSTPGRSPIAPTGSRRRVRRDDVLAFRAAEARTTPRGAGGDHPHLRGVRGRLPIAGGRIDGPVAVLDACVLYPLPLRDTLLSVAEAGLYEARWSERILDEVERNLVADERTHDGRRPVACAPRMDGHFGAPRCRRRRSMRSSRP